MKYLLNDWFFLQNSFRFIFSIKNWPFGDWYSVPAMYEPPPLTLSLRSCNLGSFLFWNEKLWKLNFNNKWNVLKIKIMSFYYLKSFNNFFIFLTKRANLLFRNSNILISLNLVLSLKQYIYIWILRQNI